MVSTVRNRISDIRHANGEWTGLQLILDEAIGIADAGLANAWRLIARINDMADNEIARMETKGSKP
jgi:hypothetical protein